MYPGSLSWNYTLFFCIYRSIAYDGAQGPFVVSPENIDSAGSPTYNTQATVVMGASQGRASNKRKLTH